MQRTLVIALSLLVGAVLAPTAQAGGGHYGYGVHVGGYRHYGPPVFVRHAPPRRYYGHGPYYGPRVHYGRHRGHDRGRYAAAGLLFGLALGNALADRGPRVVERRVIHRGGEPDYRSGATGPRASSSVVEEALPALGYRLARDGTCWLVEDAGDGRTVATEVPPEDC